MNKSKQFGALIIIAVILTCIFTKANAQGSEEETTSYYVEKPRIFYAGLIVGANFSQVDGDYYAGYYKIGANFGGIVYARIAPHVALSMEILYSQKGSKSNGAQQSLVLPNVYMLKYGINVNYAEVPIMINYFDTRRSHAGIGFSYSRLTTSSETLQIDSVNTIRNVDLSAYTFKTNAFDFIAGADLHLWQGLFLNIRFQYSIIPIRTDIPPIWARSEQYNNMWTARLMYLLK